MDDAAQQYAAPPTDEPGVEMDDTDATTIVVIGLVSTILVVCSVLGVTALYDRWTTQLNAERVIGAAYSDSKNALAEQDNQLNGAPREIDPTKGVYSIPIDRAMSLVVREMSDLQAAADPSSGSVN
ncbi:MAG: hypothetical protein AAGG46_00480 [Planctomycetota bacterium]